MHTKAWYQVPTRNKTIELCRSPLSRWIQVQLVQRWASPRVGSVGNLCLYYARCVLYSQRILVLRQVMGTGVLLCFCFCAYVHLVLLLSCCCPAAVLKDMKRIPHMSNLLCVTWDRYGVPGKAEGKD